MTMEQLRKGQFLQLKRQDEDEEPLSGNELTLVSARDGRPVRGSLARQACAVPELAAVGALPLRAGHLGERSGECTVSRREELRRSSGVLADIKATHMSTPTDVQTPRGLRTGQACHAGSSGGSASARRTPGCPARGTCP